jgi:Lignostilbene-alpha,beta-dioxygenase and related enzymes
MVATTNPFLLGNYGPVHDELTDEHLEVVGALPTELSGRYLRIGPNPFAMPEGPYHWFVGDGMVHGVELRDGRASWYRNRWVRTSTIATELGDAQPNGPTPPMYDSSNTNVLGHAGRILSLTEGAIPYALSPELDTIGRTDFGGPLPTGFTAHPKIDPVTGEMHGFAYSWADPNLIYHVIDASGRLVRSEPITVGGPTMIHDFALTRTHVVFFDLPVVFDLGMVERGLAMPYRWDDDYPARVGIMPRDGGDADVSWFDVEPCYVFHPMNAYDDGDTVVVDVVRHPTMFANSVEGPNDGGTPTLDRWTIDPAAGKVREERLDDRGQEFPRVNETLLMSRHRYGYAVETVNTETAFDTARVLKHDLHAGTTEQHDFANAGCPGELIFVPAADATSEDDGYLMGYVYDPTRDSSDFVVLDASDMAAKPIATVALPQRVPFGFHGNWVADPR